MKKTICYSLLLLIPFLMVQLAGVEAQNQTQTKGQGKCIDITHSSSNISSLSACYIIQLKNGTWVQVEQPQSEPEPALVVKKPMLGSCIGFTYGDYSCKYVWLQNGSKVVNPFDESLVVTNHEDALVGLRMDQEQEEVVVYDEAEEDTKTTEGLYDEEDSWLLLQSPTSAQSA